jgi:hypothetical protein
MAHFLFCLLFAAYSSLDEILKCLSLIFLNHHDSKACFIDLIMMLSLLVGCLVLLNEVLHLFDTFLLCCRCGKSPSKSYGWSRHSKDLLNYPIAQILTMESYPFQTSEIFWLTFLCFSCSLTIFILIFELLLYLKFDYDEGQLSLFLLNHLFCLVMFFDKTNHFLLLNLIKLMEHYFSLKKSNLHKSFLLNGNYVFHQNLRS